LLHNTFNLIFLLLIAQNIKHINPPKYNTAILGENLQARASVQGVFVQTPNYMLQKWLDLVFYIKIREIFLL